MKLNNKSAKLISLGIIALGIVTFATGGSTTPKQAEQKNSVNTHIDVNKEVESASVHNKEVKNLPTSTIASSATPTLAPTYTPTPTTKVYVTPTNARVQSIQPSVVQGGLSNDSHYTNSQGEEVHSPAYSDSVPAGATAKCGDGTYSFSQSRRGTCSHHGGVSTWL